MEFKQEVKEIKPQEVSFPELEPKELTFPDVLLLENEEFLNFFMPNPDQGAEIGIPRRVISNGRYMEVTFVYVFNGAGWKYQKHTKSFRPL